MPGYSMHTPAFDESEAYKMGLSEVFQRQCEEMNGLEHVVYYHYIRTDGEWIACPAVSLSLGDAHCREVEAVWLGHLARRMESCDTAFAVYDRAKRKMTRVITEDDLVMLTVELRGS